MDGGMDVLFLTGDEVGEVAVEGSIGGGGIEMAFCRLAQQAIRAGAVDMVEALACPNMQGNFRCVLTCGRELCVLCENDPEGVLAWQVARASVEGGR